MFNILIVEDDIKLRRMICTVLHKNGYTPVEAEDGYAALNILENQFIDLIISDIMMPNMDGYELAELLRKSNFNMPILMITAKDSFEDKKKGFYLGADDYMVKPININEMILRINAIFRRAKIATEHKLTIGNIILEYDSLTVYQNNIKQVLPQKEFYLLYKLLSYTNKIFTRQQIMDEIWGLDTETDERTVDVHINRLRERFKESNDFQIITIRGLGYKAVRQL